MNTSTTRVAIADQQPIVGAGLDSILRGESDLQYTTQLYNLTQLCQYLRVDTPDILLINLCLPGAVGEHLIPRLRSQYSNIRIVVLADLHPPLRCQQVLNLGAHGYVSKDVTLATLLKAIRTVASGRSYAVDSPEAVPNGSVGRSGYSTQLGLSPREHEVFLLICQGLSGQAIANQLIISKHTVETHRKNILRKLEFNSSRDMIRYAAKRGLV